MPIKGNFAESAGITAPCSNPKPQTSFPKPQTPNLKPRTPNPRHHGDGRARGRRARVGRREPRAHRPEGARFFLRVGWCAPLRTARPVGLSWTEMCSVTEAGSNLRLIDSCITQLKAQGPSRTSNESKEEEEKDCAARARGVRPVLSASRRHLQEYFAHKKQPPRRTLQ